MTSPDIIIIGSGMGGATLAAALAPTGRRIVTLERGARLQDSHDLPNLFIGDASVLPTSAAVNPSLTIAALALRTADHIAHKDLAT